MVRKNRRGDAGSGAAALVALIAVVIILYILLVPPEHRTELLEGTEGPSGFQPTTPTIPSMGGYILLSKTPGRLDTLTATQNRLYLPASFLSSEVKSKQLARAASIYTERSLFSAEPDTFHFILADPDNTDSILLSFNAKKYSGRLIIFMNGKQIFNSELSQPTNPPVEIPRQLLQRENVLEFRVSSPGIRFWATNSYLLETIQITGDVRDISKLSSTNKFIITTDDLLNTKKLTLKYLPECSPGNVGPLEILVNNQLLSKTIPLCGSPVVIDFLPDKLMTGENDLTFKTTTGNYIVDNIQIIQSFKEPIAPTYYFELEEEDLYEIQEEDDVLAMLYLSFVSPEFKNLDVYINGRTIHIGERGEVFSQEIDDYLIDGTNAIKLVPRSSGIDVTGLEITIEIES
ncbi:hypothetical protein KY335_00620 [Candidatus Woesearchaeota archaeon]|nr:hypothetical protein [Candidatus Woesearchaeota archaeon]